MLTHVNGMCRVSMLTHINGMCSQRFQIADSANEPYIYRLDCVTGVASVTSPCDDDAKICYCVATCLCLAFMRRHTHL